jgi:NAD(P)-dependent dehydrogenase (short-subunit alcohol dehydrogenase family)
VSEDRWRLDGRTALVTGAGRGLGLGCAHALAEAGAEVVVVARTGDEVEAAAEAIRAGGGRARALVADVVDEDQVVRLFDEAGDVDVLVNSAGTNRPGPMAGYAAADFDLVMGANVRGTFLTCREFGGRRLARGGPGVVVNVSSQMGTVGAANRVVYCASKHAVEGMTKALGVEWAADGIRVNAVAPTFVRTPMTEPMFADEAFLADVLRRIPTGELATVEQVADAVRYLACDASGSVTGTVLRVDGGWTAW